MAGAVAWLKACNPPFGTAPLCSENRDDEKPGARREKPEKSSPCHAGVMLLYGNGFTQRLHDPFEIPARGFRPETPR
jgi:hypothetical protein